MNKTFLTKDDYNCKSIHLGENTDTEPHNTIGYMKKIKLNI